ncbi:MAG TPA: DeoR/GlpR family DNA-binding transcription regulator [Flavisolibacter sp.]|jgi:DeoR/GlpR family transcriptional regulator of sugar metabolism|nr:DeoR/GlpR family DNA-binding transcription regulator [Flavisolibacter sp.]
MLKKERQSYILHQVNLHNKVLSADLSAQMQVSDDTIRRDLQELSLNGMLIKVHGGALSLSFYNGPAASKDIYSYDKKRIIAEKAVSMIQNGMFVLTSGGTTILEMARALPPNLHATFISCSLNAVMEYSNHPHCDVIMIGDKISKSSRFSAGPEAIARIRQLKCDLCFLGINSIDAVHGISDNDWDVVQVKKAMIESAQKVVCLSISEKINTHQPIQVCCIDKIHTLITELSPDDQLLRPYRDAGIEVV